MKLTLAQINPIVGDIPGNVQKIRAAVDQAHQQGVQLIVFTELAICGYPPKDLLSRRGFVQFCEQAVTRLAEMIPADIGVLVGHPTASGSRAHNSASLLYQGKIQGTIHKQLLPNDDVFDERRYFVAGPESKPLEFCGMKLGVHICEDAWHGFHESAYHLGSHPQADPLVSLGEQGADIYINLSASPFERDKLSRRWEVMQRHVKKYNTPFLFCNQVGGNDDLVFDGQSFVLNTQGECVVLLKAFQEDAITVDLKQLPQTKILSPVQPIDQLHEALVLGLRDYMQKSGFKDCVLGLSGGIDSAVAACIAVDAVGAEHVHGLMMPSRYSSEHSVHDAVALVKNLGIEGQIVPIDNVHQSYEMTPVIGDDLRSDPQGLTEQNLQARIRGAMVMVRSNRYGWIALATGNKSEVAMGYCTLYGDMAGGFAVLSDVYKRDVYALAEYYNHKHGEKIPWNTIKKAPSAELAPNQFDQDTLPDYPTLDGILEGLIDREESVAELSKSYPLETVLWVIRRVDRNEFKRRQIAPGIKLSRRAFGSGRRMPMAAKIFYGE